MTATNMDLATIDTASARFPERYEGARRALAETARIDECKEWANKAQALASYAKQIKDEELEKLSRRIRARAMRRAGELLAEIEPAQGGDRRSGDYQRDTGDPLISRKAAATDAGLSDRQRKTALRVASIPEHDFEQAVESDNPPTVTQLTARRNPLSQESVRKTWGDAAADDPEAFKAATFVVGALNDLAKDIKGGPSAGRIVSAMNLREREEARIAIEQIVPFITELTERINGLLREERPARNRAIG